MQKVLFFRDFDEDYRLSMDLYADNIFSSLRLLGKENVIFDEYKPHVPKWSQGKIGIRFARYILYPLQVLGKKASIYHIIGTGYSHLTYFLNPKKCIISVHDLIPILLWKRMIQGVTPDRIPLLALITFNSIKRASHLIAVSNCTKNDLIRLLGIEPQKISVVYSGIDPIYKQYDIESKNVIREKWFGIDNKKRILITGSQFYKNHKTVLETISFLRSTGLENIQLIKTGVVTKEWQKLIQNFGLENHVTNVGVLPRERMPELYNAVDLLMFPSIYEGFGWPPLEAMACGTPVVSSNAASLPEVIGSTGLMKDPYDYVGFGTSIHKLLSDESYYQQFVEQGLMQAKKFTWEQTAFQLNKLYEDMLRNPL